MGKMRMFLRQTTVGREPLAIAMSGVRLGERLLQIGIDTPLVTSLLAAKPGLSGESSIVVVDEAELVERRRAWTPRPPRHRAGALAKYARLVGQAPGGAVTHEGPAEWPWFD